jgi:MFS family permease
VFNTYAQKLHLFSRDVRLFLVTAVLVGFAWDGVRTVLYNLYLLRLGYTPEFVGLANAVGALAFSLFCLPAGMLGTRLGSRNMLIAGLGLLALGYGLLPLAESVPEGWRTYLVLGATLLAFLALALFLVNGLPFMMGATGPEERSHVFSVHIALVPLSGFCGSLVGGLLPEVLSKALGASVEDPALYAYPMWLAAVLLVPGMLVLLGAHPTHGRAEPAPPAGAPVGRKGLAPYGLLIAVALVTALRFGGRATTTTFFNVYLDEGLGVSTALIGALVAAGQLFAIPAALLSPWLVARRGNVGTIVWGSVGVALCTLPLALVPHWTAAGFGFVTSWALFSATIGPMRVFTQELVAPRWRASMASIFMMGAGLAFSSVSLAGGFVITAVGYQMLFLTGTGLLALATLLFWAIFRVPRGEYAHQELKVTD